ncbi:o-succinylbenzoate--CoA ligase [Amycolatopsis cihanbeyliensis]|uniref:O-succinylbenzoic acid--CoA ligase n=1 Tax=Amycolatopsis cihanbeyliensis TaxID=1128664 RepID=A0A542DJS2_AMYCI|nr:o-succinylbenzoate--CoA ligase [Amycolatopsis cihanbeyliensis]TQJ03326.1 O-succinylbenzoic acid--CoA ligase [Amycolatopsis cihanbeyliensis]
MREVRTDGTAEAIGRLSRSLAEALGGGPAVLPLDTRDPGAERLRTAMRPESPVEPGTAVIVPTSGSTGTRKGVLLSAEALTASARATHDRLGGPGRWLLATPAHYIGGLQVLVRALLAGREPAVLDLSAGFDVDAFTAAAAELCTGPGPYYTALVPTQLARLVAAGGAAAAAAARFDAIVLGGAALPERLRVAARDAGITAVPAYGMSETASGCVYAGVPLAGVRVRIGVGERIEIAGPVLAHGYRLRPELSERVFADGWFRTGDLGRLGPDGALDVLGRADDMINTGGVKVSAAEVERVLGGRPGVAGCCVLGLPDPEWGESVTAVVVPADPAAAGEALRAELRAAVRAELGAACVPKRLVYVAELPLRGPGKVDRAALRGRIT